MRRPRSDGDVRTRTRRLEMLIFLVVCAVGVYAFGSGMRAMTGSGGGVGLAWLAIAGVAMWILFSQMGRVHDSWPRRNAERLSAPRSGAEINPSKAAVASKVSTHRTDEVS